MSDRKNSKAPALDSQTLARLAGGLAHELKNPLSTIGLHLTLLKEDWTSEEDVKSRRAVKTLNTLTSEVERLNNILEDFLRFARTDTLEYALEDINSLIELVLVFARPETERVGVQIHSYLDLNLPKVWLDARRIQQVVLNLLINSRQAIEVDREGGNISLISRQEGAFVVIEIVDDGPGMEPDTLSQCFDVYFSTKAKGSGLGLATVRRIVEAHGGELAVESSIGKGTKVQIRIPISAYSNE
jgi:two-component system sensor histidine kinase HydH